MSIYKFVLDDAALYAAANAACSKVTAVRCFGCARDKYFVETSSDMDAAELAAVEAALVAIAPALAKES